MTEAIALQAGAARCTVLPALGGSLGGWWIAGQPLLRPADPAALQSAEPTGLSAFPLVPYSNRIEHGRFAWNGRAHSLALNRAGEPHALHGIGWQRPWQVTSSAARMVELALDHRGDADWPWPFAARQQITLSEDCLDLRFSVRNDADEAVPLSFGYHPYFVRDAARVRLAAGRVWLADAANLPERAVAPSGDFDLSGFAPVAGREIDNCYERVRWPAEIGWRDRPLRVLIEPSGDLGCAVVYSNAAAGALCIEPVAHLSNALNMAGAESPVPVVAPRASSQSALRLRATANPGRAD